MTETDGFLTLGFAAIDWIEHYLVHGPGDVQGQPIELDDEFAAFILKAYKVDGRGERGVRRAFLSRAKGRSKSGVAAMIACFEALGPCRFDHFAEDGEISAWGYEYEPGEPVGKPLVYAEILNVATEESQAGNTYDAIYYMLNPETCSAELLRDFGRIDIGLTRTNLPNKRGFIEPVTSADTSKDGGKSTFIVADETHLWVLPRLKRLHGVMTRNLLKRKAASGWMLETSTMYGEGEDSVAEGTHAYAKSLSNGRKKDPTLLFDHKQAAAHWDLAKRSERLKALREAYGPAAAWMNLDAICDSYDDPQVSEAEFRRYWLNQPVPTTEPVEAVISLAAWLRNDDDESRPETLAGFGVDITPDRAFGAIGVAGQRADAKSHVELLGQAAGTDWIVNRCVELNESHGPLPFIVDAGGPAGSLVTTMRSHGLEVVELNIRELGRACVWMADAIKHDTVKHGPDEALQGAIEGLRKKNIGDGLFRFTRNESTTYITPIMAVTLACHALLNQMPVDDVTVAFL